MDFKSQFLAESKTETILKIDKDLAKLWTKNIVGLLWLTLYKYVLNSVVNISLMFAYFDYYAIILRGRFFVDCNYLLKLWQQMLDLTKHEIQKQY